MRFVKREPERERKRQRETPNVKGVENDFGIVKAHADMVAWPATLHTAETQGRLWNEGFLISLSQRTTADSSPGVCSAGRTAVIAGFWQ